MKKLKVKTIKWEFQIRNDGLSDMENFDGSVNNFLATIDPKKISQITYLNSSAGMGERQYPESMLIAIINYFEDDNTSVDSTENSGDNNESIDSSSDHDIHRKSWFEELEIGAIAVYKTWLKKYFNTAGSFEIKLGNGEATVVVSGNAVVEDYDNEDESWLIGTREKITFININGTTTVLNDLSIDDTYQRIRSFYLEILKKCLGKTLEDQQDIISYLYTGFKFSKNADIVLKQGDVENSKIYIENLPTEIPVSSLLEDLVAQISNGCLKYCSPVKDMKGVKMIQYANALKKKL